MQLESCAINLALAGKKSTNLSPQPRFHATVDDSQHPFGSPASEQPTAFSTMIATRP
jgi:hypothetical protein